MFSKILSFEIRYRLRRPATYTYFMILFLMTFLAVISENFQIGEASSLVHRNSPYSINLMVTIMMVFGTMIISAVMGVPVYRDFEHSFHEIMFTTPVKKWEYLGGRFFGSYIIALFIFCGLLFGIFVGSIWPTVDHEKIGPLMLHAYTQPFLVLIVPNIFMLGILFFSMGSLFRNQLAIYVQGVIFFALYLIILSNQRDITHNRVLSILDPFGLSATGSITRYWTTAEKNTTVVPFAGYLLYNRLLWTGIALVIGSVFYRLFKFSKAAPSVKKKKTIEQDEPSVLSTTLTIPQITISESFFSRFKQWWHLVKFDFKGVIKAIPFIAITLCGVLILGSNSSHLGSQYGTSTFPVTYMILDLLTGNFVLFIIIIITFYSGELLWKEIDSKLAPIIDSSSLSNHLILTAKFSAMILVEIVLLFVLVITGIILQTMNGFYDYEIAVYIKSLLLNTFPYLFLITLLTFLIHSLVNNKFLGHVIVIIFWLGNLVLASYDITHNMIYYGNTPSASYSGMNGFGHFVYPILMFDFYWLMLGIVFFALTLLMMKRGSEINFRSRLKAMKSLWKEGTGKLIIPVCIVLFIVCGGFIYYNTNILNVYHSPKAQNKLSADYEKKYRKFLNKRQPRITDVKVNVDLFPYERNCKINGTYIIKNKTAGFIDSLIVMLPAEAKINQLTTGITSAKVLNDKEQGFYIYKFSKPLASGDSTTLSFDLNYGEKRFPNDGGNTNIVYNGTFINNDLMPHFGYNEEKEITNDDKRKEENLPKKYYRMNLITDTIAMRNTYLAQDADWIRYEATVSTAPDQIAISPGYLQKEWTENGRRYFHYKMDCPIWNFYSFLSARYEVLRDKYKGVNIEIYYHKGHEYDLDKMVKAIKKTLDYCNANFSPYQHKQVRIIEFPRYQLFAQSFPNTIPFSEGIGFIYDVDKESDIDMAFYVTAHEVGHQWWGHQVAGANVQGSTMMVESLAQYTALMVMEHEYGKAHMEKFLKYELDGYLRGRAQERKREQPLMLNENQQYIHYQKGSLVFYALKDYIGEDTLNAALSRYIKRYAFQEPPYTTAIDFVNYMKQATPDSLQYIITDLFETITLFNNKTESVTSEKITGGNYKITLQVEAKKMRADSLGNEKQIPLKDWIDIGVYVEDKTGKDSLIYLQKHFVNNQTQKFEIIVNRKPVKAGIDPLHKLIDRDTEDNVKKI